MFRKFNKCSEVLKNAFIINSMNIVFMVILFKLSRVSESKVGLEVLNA